VTGRILTSDKHGMVQGLSHDLPPEIFLRPTPLTTVGPAVAALARSFAAGRHDLIERLHRLAGRLHGHPL
jgi:hypothetical protein